MYCSGSEVRSRQIHFRWECSAWNSCPDSQRWHKPTIHSGGALKGWLCHRWVLCCTALHQWCLTAMLCFIEGEDYHGKEFTVKFEVGITSMSLQVPIVSDKVTPQEPQEGDEYFTLNISYVDPDTRVGIETPNMTLVLIRDIRKCGCVGCVNIVHCILTLIGHLSCSRGRAEWYCELYCCWRPIVHHPPFRSQPCWSSRIRKEQGVSLLWVCRQWWWILQPYLWQVHISEYSLCSGAEKPNYPRHVRDWHQHRRQPRHLSWGPCHSRGVPNTGGWPAFEWYLPQWRCGGVCTQQESESRGSQLRAGPKPGHVGVLH